MLAGEHTLAAINRTYYTVYYAICALLFSKGVHARTHQGAHSKFNELFVKSGLFTIEEAKLVSDSFALRQTADYDFEATISDATAYDLVRRTRIFLDTVIAYFRLYDYF
ncbi:HEPN domain-containing protein [Larkinella sp. VNQ87]|uniref:HEPN domain-containing protein n=1 Tax=Larkinella sp. VNQ87 TaxID=3400921 RepID=UPI003C0D9BD7